MWNKPTPTQLAKLPKLYQTEHTPLKEKLIRLHFFLGGCDWYIVEFDGEDLFFGYAILNGDRDNAEWGYVSLRELTTLRTGQGFEVDRDLHWTPKKVSEIPHIRT